MATWPRETESIVDLQSYRLEQELKKQTNDPDILPTAQFLSRKFPNDKAIRMKGIFYYGDLAIEIKMWSSRITSIHWQNPR